MEPANKPPVRDKVDQTVIEFLPDADEIERRPLPRVARITLHVVVAMLISFVVWASLFEVDQVVVARGRLITPASNFIVQPLETAIIESIDVSVGQVVKKGQKLAALDPTFTQADEAQLRARVESLDIEIKRLQAEVAGGAPSGDAGAAGDARLQAELSGERRANYQARLTQMEQTAARMRASLETNVRDQQALAERVTSLREIETMQEKLVAQQFTSRSRLLEAQERRQEVERELQLAKNREQELRREMTAFEGERAVFKKGWRQKTMEDLLAATRDRDALNEQLQKADKRSKLVTLTAPSDAVVLDIANRSQGSVVKEGETLFTLVPLGGELEAEVRIDSVDIGYIRLDDVAYVKMDAYPYERHGAVLGRVRTISEDAFRREGATEVASLGQGTDAFYMSRIKLGSVGLKKMPKKARLLPGMTLKAEIVVGKRSVMSYLIWPLTKALNESIREP